MPKGPVPKNTATIGIRLEPPMRSCLEKFAIEEERTLSAMARILIREGIWTRLGLGPKGAKAAAASHEEVFLRIEEFLKDGKKK